MTKLSATFLATLIATGVNAATIDLRIMETTDLHSNIMDFDYYKDAVTEKLGLVCTTTLIEQTRTEAKNSVLMDNGDVIQGSPLGNYMATKGLKEDDVHPVYKAVNTPNYAVGNLGNHEFGHDLDFPHKALAGAKFPCINTNIIDVKTGKPIPMPYLIQDTRVTDSDSQPYTLRIGCIGFAPPQIMTWDKVNLSDRVTVNNITEIACKYTPEMQAKGADVVVMVAHSGLSADPHQTMAENSVYYLSQVPDVDAIILGCTRVTFPGKDFANIKDADIAKGALNGIPAVVPGMWGNHLGVVDLVLDNGNSKWQVTQNRAEARPICDAVAKRPLAAEDGKLVAVLKADHDATRGFIGKPIGKSVNNVYSYLALVQDGLIVQAINMAQRVYVEHCIQGDLDLVKLSVPSVAASLKAGGRKNDPTNFVEVGKGQLTFRDAANLYLYPNTLVVIKVSGKEVKEWLEYSAGQFNQIDSTSNKPQSLINWDGLRTYSFDVVGRVNYQVDVTQPIRYNGEYQMTHPRAEHIKHLTFNGKPVDPRAASLVAANNYRAYGSKFADTGESHTALVSLDENRSVLAVWIGVQSKKDGTIYPTTDNNWCLAPIHNNTPLDIRFETSPDDKAAAFIKEKAQYPMRQAAIDDIGFAIYQLDLSK